MVHSFLAFWAIFLCMAWIFLTDILIWVAAFFAVGAAIIYAIGQMWECLKERDFFLALGYLMAIAIGLPAVLYVCGQAFFFIINFNRTYVDCPQVHEWIRYGI